MAINGDETRREHLKIISAIGATCAFPFAADELYAQTGPATSNVWAAGEFAVISALAEIIIPETNTPGATKAGVPAYIELVVSRNAEQAKRLKAGVAWLNGHASSKAGKPFLALSADERVALLTPLSVPGHGDQLDAGRTFFQEVKNLTADGYYTSRVGLMEELGYEGNHVMAGFAGCEHDRKQAGVHEH